MRRTRFPFSTFCVCAQTRLSSHAEKKNKSRFFPANNRPRDPIICIHDHQGKEEDRRILTALVFERIERIRGLGRLRRREWSPRRIMRPCFLAHTLIIDSSSRVCVCVGEVRRGVSAHTDDFWISLEKKGAAFDQKAFVRKGDERFFRSPVTHTQRKD